jgi:amidophosphoribosyltransferase
MCGIIGLLLANENEFVNQMLFDGLTVLQHRGQDAAGMVTAERRRLHLRKDNGLVKDVFQAHHMLELRGNMGIGHVRYPTAGTSSCAEAQPLYTNYPFGICVAHNGNLTNTEELTLRVEKTIGRHVNTDSDSELLLNLFAEYLTAETRKADSHQSKTTTNGNSEDDTDFDMKEAVFTAASQVMQICRGGYAGLYLINGFGLVGFRDPHGIRPLVFGCRKAGSNADELDDEGIPVTPAVMGNAERSYDYVISSESVAVDTLGFKLIRDVNPGEAIFIDMDGNCHTRQCHMPNLAPCIFEYVYFARPDSIMDGVSVYETRLKMGDKLAGKVLREYPDHDIDVVIPIPDTSRTSALQAAYKLDRPFREGFIKNRYIARTFIMPGQATRRKSVRLKLNTIKSEFAGKNVLLVDDSIVRGTTANEIVQMARDAGARKVYFSSAAPPIRYPNIYGIDIPTREELVAYQRNEEEIAKEIGCDWVVYQDLTDLEDSIREAAPKGVELKQFDTSCFSGQYVTGEQIGDDYFTRLHEARNDGAKEKRKQPLQGGPSAKKPQQSNNGCESVNNDKRETVGEEGGSCEPLTNQPMGLVR